MKNTEITIDDIYNRLYTATKIDKQALEKIRQIELETEKELSFLNTAIVDEIKSHIAAGERVVLISDMYWGKTRFVLFCRKKTMSFAICRFMSVVITIPPKKRRFVFRGI